MGKHIAALVAALVAMQSVRVGAGPLSLACASGCHFVCASCLASTVGWGAPVCYAAWASCMTACAASAPVACQDGSNHVTYRNGTVAKVRDIRPGEQIAALDSSDSIVYSTVVENKPTSGEFAFTRVSLAGMLGFAVTDEHVLVVKRGDRWEIEKARNVCAGDVMLTSSGSLARVQLTQSLVLPQKWALGTQHGTALVNSVRMTTFCDDSFDILPKEYTAALEAWLEMHSYDMAHNHPNGSMVPSKASDIKPGMVMSPLE